ncbi:2-C-methyl-D-erythritol 4-phosphate cytidylyltransferase [Granulicella tundricola]|uniref:2-C-methyl-D-erythritol 4-phosphate cytidylyltransferase n=1 Tax=Granulicella tundricola (strain ATCC BAA-1859 / DSM 23138 / MP5ACTX9) TaxID=1198114 RepID=E8X317_GRATM|nr:2-C-methyl-D-erythritol 4-phosphate cytidylyltransferase [Granulicella tundricola]ADW68151.1 2-C-methyl-D-erythritol 4-phosphate cytidylyltransferase [Granulicella tundricola MP5ACTX9]
MQVFVILPAAGIGTRMSSGGDKPAAAKQFVTIAGVPVLVHSLRAFLAVDSVAQILVAVRAPEVERVTELIHRFSLDAKVKVVEGGEHRQGSVANALATLDCAPDDIVLVHDAVRPLIEPATIERTIEAIAKYGAAIVGMPAVDTIKQVERTADGAIVSSTIPRERVVHAQTPQGARFHLLKKAFDEAEGDEFSGTDESSLLERSNVQVHVVPGSARNFKITQPGDLELAEFYLAHTDIKTGGTR